jgi:hypothetical protein
MANELKISGKMHVKTLKSQFKEVFGLTLRVYDGRSFADDNSTLAQVRKGDAKGGEFAPQRNTKVGSFEDKMMSMFGIKVQVAGSDDSYLCNNDLTLAGAQEEDKRKMEKKERKAVKSEGVVENTQNSGVQAMKDFLKLVDSVQNLAEINTISDEDYMQVIDGWLDIVSEESGSTGDIVKELLGDSYEDLEEYSSSNDGAIETIKTVFEKLDENSIKSLTDKMKQRLIDVTQNNY